MKAVCIKRLFVRGVLTKCLQRGAQWNAEWERRIMARALSDMLKLFKRFFSLRHYDYDYDAVEYGAYKASKARL